MADDAVTVEQLRRWYLDTLRASVLATDPVRVTAWTGLAAEIRAALGDAGVVERVPTSSGEVATSGAPAWRSVATDPPPHGEAIIVMLKNACVTLRFEGGCWVYAGGSPYKGAEPTLWMPIPPVWL